MPLSSWTALHSHSDNDARAEVLQCNAWWRGSMPCGNDAGVQRAALHSLKIAPAHPGLRMVQADLTGGAWL